MNPLHLLNPASLVPTEHPPQFVCLDGEYLQRVDCVCAAVVPARNVHAGRDAHVVNTHAHVARLRLHLCRAYLSQDFLMAGPPL